MKLAELLQQRSDLQKANRHITARISNNLSYQEGETSIENPNELIAEQSKNYETLENLVKTINRINTLTVVEGKTLTEWIAKKDRLSQEIADLRLYVQEASYKTNRNHKTEIKTVCAVDVKSLQKKVDSLSAELRRVDNLIQSTNWATEV